MRFALKIVKIVVVTFVFIIILRIFLFASYVIPSRSMQPTLLPGDRIIVNKLIPGPRVDRLGNRSESEFNSTIRYSGIRSIQRKDVIVFNPPYFMDYKIRNNSNIHIIKRCTGEPGDSLKIQNGIYHIKNKMGKQSFIPLNGKIKDSSWMATFVPENFKKYKWTLGNFGPIYIPQKGDKIQINQKNIELYKNLIEYETHHKILISQSFIKINNVPIDSFQFSQNYYFVSGDYSEDSEDSRFWGLLPEDHIVGKAMFIWNSIDLMSKKIRFERIFKPIQ